MPRRQWYSYESREAYLSEGVNDAFIVTHLSIARECSEDSPYLIPNEWIAGSIGTFLRLPVPPFALIRRDTHRGMFASLRFGKKDNPPSDMVPAACVRNDPSLCTGILLFDILVANGDRHRANLKVDDKDNPQEFMVFDHDRALLGAGIAPLGAARLDYKFSRLGVSDGTSAGDSRHCLLGSLNTVQFFDEWIRRIETIPDWFIHELCAEMQNGFLSQNDADAVALFLKYRKDNLRTLITNNKQKFSSIRDWGLFA